jgi:ferric-chelate reductase [NAD(P)H]
MDIKALFDLSYGVYVVSSKNQGKYNGQIANAAIQVTSDPPKILVCLNKNNLTHQYIKKSKIFSISILEKETPLKFIGIFGFRSGRDFNKFKEVSYQISERGTPYVTENTLGYLECELTETLDVGTHTLFVGKLIEAKKLKQGEPLTYAQYHEIKKGKTPKNAPTYVNLTHS